MPPDSKPYRRKRPKPRPKPTPALVVSLNSERDSDGSTAALVGGLRALGISSQSIAQARAAGKSVSVCGEMAGDPVFTELLLGMGLRSFSMHPSQIPAVKQRVLRADAQRLAVALPSILGSDDPQAAAEKELALIRGGAAVH